MKLRKLFITTALTSTAVITPIGVMTSCSCSQAWGNLTPYTIGASTIDNENSPYYNFRGDTSLVDKDGIAINSYIQSNYIIDVAKSTYYGYSTPVASRTNYDADPTQFTYNDGNAGWYSSIAHGFASTFKNKLGKDATCYKNVTLGGNIGFTTTIGQFINRYITLALNYQLTQLPTKSNGFNKESFDTAWGGEAPEKVEEKKTDRDFMEWIFANSNSHATGATEAMMKTTSTNFNYIDMPIPAYADDGSKNYNVSSATKTLLMGTDTAVPGSTDDKYYTALTKKDEGKDTEVWTITYEAVPVLVRATNLTQRWINPKIKDTYQIAAYYEYKDGKTMKMIDKSLVQKKVGNAWTGMSNYIEDGGSTKPEWKGFKLAAPAEADSKSIDKESIKDARLGDRVKGTDFVAFVTYTYVHNVKHPEKDTVTLSSLQAIMPAYMFAIKSDLYKHSHDPETDIVDTTKVNTYCNELLALLNRSSKDGKKASAKDVSTEGKKYLQFLNYVFKKNGGWDKSWLSPIQWQ